MAIEELYGLSTEKERKNWAEIVLTQNCPFLDRKCLKIRKSEPSKTIGTCSVSRGSDDKPIMICPHRFLAGHQIFFDAIHLLTAHQPGNELHVLSEFSVPGGSIDYMLVSAKKGKVTDFVGVELQTLDTTGTLWPARQAFLDEIGALPAGEIVPTRKPYGFNWKMTAKTILMQMHHKLATFENVNRRLVLVLQTDLMDYMRREFNFGHLESPPVLADSLHFHAYSLDKQDSAEYSLALETRASTDDEGMSKALGLMAEANVELNDMLDSLTRRISPDNALRFGPALHPDIVTEE